MGFDLNIDFKIKNNVTGNTVYGIKLSGEDMFIDSTEINPRDT